jgi:methylated-DNA-[protein]-cysteine S-methyltransferase
MASGLRFHVFETDLGWVGVANSDTGLRAIKLPHKTRAEAIDRMMEAGATEPAPATEAKKIQTAIGPIVEGKKPATGLSIDWSGITPFRRAVLEACMAIPPGTTVSYGELAERVGHPRAARAVGRVMATNPWPLLVPCHRVVGSTGHLHGYGGGLPMKEQLLRAEGVSIPAR